MSQTIFKQYRSRNIDEEEDDMDILDDEVKPEEKPSTERKWYKHVYKSSLGKGKFRNYHKSNENRDKNRGKNRSNDRIKKEFHKYCDDVERKSGLDARSRIIDRNRRDAQLQKDYIGKLTDLYFPKSAIEKTFVVNVDGTDRRQVQMQVKSEK